MLLQPFDLRIPVCPYVTSVSCPCVLPRSSSGLLAVSYEGHGIGLWMPALGCKDSEYYTINGERNVTALAWKPKCVCTVVPRCSPVLFSKLLLLRLMRAIVWKRIPANDVITWSNECESNRVCSLCVAIATATSSHTPSACFCSSAEVEHLAVGRCNGEVSLLYVVRSPYQQAPICTVGPVDDRRVECIAWSSLSTFIAIGSVFAIMLSHQSSLSFFVYVSCLAYRWFKRILLRVAEYAWAHVLPWFVCVTSTFDSECIDGCFGVSRFAVSLSCAVPLRNLRLSLMCTDERCCQMCLTTDAVEHS